MAQALVRIGRGAQALRILIALLSHQTTEVRAGAAFALGQLGINDSSRVGPLLETMRTDPSGRVRMYACDALADIGRPVALIAPAMIVALRDRNARVREIAAWSLGRMISHPPSKSVPRLVQALADRKDRVREFAARALFKIGRPALPALLRATRSSVTLQRRGAFRALVLIGDPGPGKQTRAAFLRGLSDASAKVRGHAAQGLGAIKPTDAAIVDALLSTLRDPDRDAAERAGWALVSIGSPALPAMVKALRVRHPYMQWHLARAFEALGPKAAGAVTGLIDALTDSEHVSTDDHQVVRALAAIGKPAVKPLIARASSKDKFVRKRVAVALRALGQTARPAVDVLLRLLSDPSREVRGEAAWSLGSLGQPARKILPALLESLDDRDLTVRNNAAAAIELICQKHLLIDRRGAPKLPPAELRKRVARLMRQLGHRDYPTRRRATAALIALGRDALPILQARLPRITNLEARIRAGQIVDRMAPKAIIRKLRKTDASLLPAIELLGRHGLLVDRIVRTLIQRRLDDQAEEIHDEAAATLRALIRKSKRD